MTWKGRLTVPAAFLLVAAGVCSALRQNDAGSQNPYAVFVQVGLVVLPVVVRDRHGACVSGLRQTDFHVFENGVPQEIQQFDSQDTPVALGLVLDNSGSMRAKRGEVVRAAVSLIRHNNPRDQVFIVRFNEDIDYGLPADKPFTSDVAQLEAAAGNAAPTGRTTLYDAIVAGLDHLEQSALRRKALVVVSDGGDNASRHTLPQTEDEAVASNAVIYAISIEDETSTEPRPRILKRLSKETGGLYFRPREVTLRTDTAKRIATDLRTQYTLGYVPTDRRKDGSYRSIRVVVDPQDHRHLSVRTRAGYIAPKNS